MIDGKIHCKYTWTGKSSNNQTKLAFSELKEIIGLLYAVVRLADATYSLKDCERDLTYKVLKRAIKTKDNVTNEPTTSNSDVAVVEEPNEKLIKILLQTISNNNSTRNITL